MFSFIIVTRLLGTWKTRFLLPCQKPRNSLCTLLVFFNLEFNFLTVATCHADLLYRVSLSELLAFGEEKS